MTVMQFVRARHHFVGRCMVSKGQSGMDSHSVPPLPALRFQKEQQFIVFEHQADAGGARCLVLWIFVQFEEAPTSVC